MTNDHPDGASTSAPNDDLHTLNVLVGTWEITGDATGEVTYEWINDGHFLLQRFLLRLEEHTVQGIEVIGHLQPFGEEPSTDIYSRAYDNSGNTLDYVYEVNDGVLTIWGGERGSASYFRGTFTDDDTNVGEWVYEGGGGYATTMRRMPA